MSFFGKFKGAAASGAQTTTASPSKKDPNAVQPTALERHLKDVTGPVRTDGSDKFFGFENYGSTCYCNSILQCLYYSAPFRDHVMNFPPKEYLDSIPHTESDGTPLLPRSTSQIPYPNPTSPARKEYVAPPSATNANIKQEESKDSPEYKKRTAIKTGLVLGMIHDRSNNYGMEESLFTALKDMFDAIKHNSSRYGTVSPHKFLEILRRENEMFRSAMHQDAHEFLNLLLNQVVDSVELFSKQHPTLSVAPASNGALDKAVTSTTNGHKTSANGVDTRWVHDLFEGLLTSETRCLTCENTSQRDEPFLDLSVDLSAHTSVTSCLRKFSEEEMLCERNKFHCDNCGGLQEAEKRMKIKRLPRVLALHLKRFKYTEDLQRLQKLFHRVVYPFHLRLFNTTDDAEDPDRLYELYAVVVHIGGGPYHGHYVTIVKTQDRGWLLFDDELVEPVTKAYVQGFFGGEPVPGLQDARQLACAYVLFYQETTLEAMLKEQELENQQPTAAAAAAASRVSDVDAVRDPLLSPTSAAPNGLYTIHTTNTVLPSTVPPLEHTGPLTHAVTAPDTPLSPGDAGDTTTGAPATGGLLERSKTRKELKAEQKARKAAEKAEAKALDEKRREASTRRLEAWREAKEQMAAAIEASRLSALEEAKSRGEEPPLAVVGAANSHKDAQNGGALPGLGRFARHPSLSIRGKPRWLGGGGGGGNNAAAAAAGDPAAATGKLPPQEEGDGAVVDGRDSGEVDEKLAGLPTATSAPLISPPPAAGGEERIAVKKNRFSIGRKRSQAMAG